MANRRGRHHVGVDVVDRSNLFRRVVAAVERVVLDLAGTPQARCSKETAWKYGRVLELLRVEGGEHPCLTITAPEDIRTCLAGPRPSR